MGNCNLDAKCKLLIVKCKVRYGSNAVISRQIAKC